MRTRHNRTALAYYLAIIWTLLVAILGLIFIGRESIKFSKIPENLPTNIVIYDHDTSEVFTYEGVPEVKAGTLYLRKATEINRKTVTYTMKGDE